MKLTDNLYLYPERGMMDANTYLLRDNSVTIIVDPGSAQTLPVLLREMQREGNKPESVNIIVNTHLHPDHYAANAGFKQASGARIMMHSVQRARYDGAAGGMAHFLGISMEQSKADGLIDAAELTKGSLQLEMILAPGHSPDSVCYYSRTAKFLICGDVLFQENTGRVDLPGGNGTQLKASIEALAKLDIEYLLPGHGDIVTGAVNVKQNFQYIRENVLAWL